MKNFSTEEKELAKFAQNHTKLYNYEKRYWDYWVAMEFIWRVRGHLFYFLLMYRIGCLYVGEKIHVGQFCMLIWYTWDMTNKLDQVS